MVYAEIRAQVHPEKLVWVQEKWQTLLLCCGRKIDPFHDRHMGPDSPSCKLLGFPISINPTLQFWTDFLQKKIKQNETIRLDLIPWNPTTKSPSRLSGRKRLWAQDPVLLLLLWPKNLKCQIRRASAAMLSQQPCSNIVQCWTAAATETF